ncbi:MAG: FAD-dependent oxidoreductase, partial [Hyphomicrobiales bacterium]
MTNTSVAIVGAGIVGHATAHYLCACGYGKNLTVIDQGAPMGFTSAQSGENYRNWWPHPVMQGLMDASTVLMEEIVRKTDN